MPWQAPKPKSVTPNQGKVDPIHAYHFAIEIDGLQVARFTDASGFDHQTTVIEHREVDNNGNIYINKTMGGTKWSDITLKRGITVDNSLWEKWRQHVMNGDYDQARKTVTINALDPKGETSASFIMQRAWISKWKGPAFSAKSDQIAVEEITFTHEGIQRVQ